MEQSNCDELQDADYTLYRIEDPLLHRLPAHDGAIRALEYASDLDWTISGGDDGILKMWDAKAGEEVSSIAVIGTPQILSLL
jgi:WD40 repeat protein